jgi:hypothetical protein
MNHEVGEAGFGVTSGYVPEGLDRGQRAFTMANQDDALNTCGIAALRGACILEAPDQFWPCSPTVGGDPCGAMTRGDP